MDRQSYKIREKGGEEREWKFVGVFRLWPRVNADLIERQ